MKFSLKKRQTVLAALVVFLGVAVLVNWYYTKPENKIKSTDSVSDEYISNADGLNLGDAVYVSGTDTGDEYFAGAKLSRDESYDEAVATLREIIDSSDVDSQSVKTAADSLNSLSRRKVAQANIENLVTAKTGSQCIAVISEDSAEIIVNPNLINNENILRIKEIVMDNTDFTSEKITIIGAK